MQWTGGNKDNIAEFENKRRIQMVNEYIKQRDRMEGKYFDQMVNEYIKKRTEIYQESFRKNSS